MSHIATNWAFQQRGLKPSAKIILLALADCHNPVHGCFPTQAFLSDVCEVNRDTVNAQLKLLEDRKLIRRVRSVDPQTKRQRPTRYKLAFEGDFELADGGETASEKAGNSVSEIPTQPPGAVSEKPAEPCRKNAESRVGNSDTNLVKEKVIKPARAHTRGEAPEETGQVDEDFQRFWRAHPRPLNRDRTLLAWNALEDEGIAADAVIWAAERYKDENLHTPMQYRISSDLWLEQRRWDPQPTAARKASPLAMHWASAVKAGKYVPSSAIKMSLAREMVETGLLDTAALRRIGVYL
ncbi:MAG: helix-turn-helix domain-containing protein [Hyphomonas sp.]